ncbi:MAG: phosphoglycolate phosphatase [Rhodospirillales bacterium]
MTALLFDLDGTLVDSVPDVCASLNDVLALEGLAAVSEAHTKALVGGGARDMVKTLLAERGADGDEGLVDKLMRAFLETYAANPARHSRVYPGVVEALEFFHAEGRALAVCTNKPEATTGPVLKALGLADYFAAVVCPEHVKHRKPDGRHVLDTAAALGKTGAECILIGDSETDVRAANDAGVKCVCVTYGYCHVPFESLNADVFVDSFDQVPAAVRRLL